jgi:hypothetical protein
MASMVSAQHPPIGGLAKLGEGPRTTSDLSRVGGGLSRGANEGKKLNAAPWSDTFPAAGATLDLDFANNRGFVRGVGQGGVMDAITFTRASNGTFVKPDGTLSTHANQGALGNNLLTFPQDFDNAEWAKSDTTIQPKVEIAPNNTLTADLLIANLTGGVRYIQNTSKSFTTSISYNLSFYVKKNTHNFVQILFGSAAFGFEAFANFDIELGIIGTFGTNATATIQDVGNGWYRCAITSVATSTASTVPVIAIVPSNSSSRFPAFSGANGTESVFIWGAQLEVGSTATEYFPTNIGEPRFDWASTEQVAQRNLVIASENFVLSSWSKSNITVTDNESDPVGGLNATLLTLNAGNNLKLLNRLTSYPSSPSGTEFTWSLYAKAGTVSIIQIDLSANHGAPSFANFDLSDGTVGTTGTNITATNVLDVGSGWYRVSITAPCTANPSSSSFTNIAIVPDKTSGRFVNFNANGTETVFIYASQFEFGTTATEYQATGAQVPSTTPLRANPTSNGILIEEARTNRLLWNRDATQTEWVKTNITAAKDQTGIDGVANSASSLTATDDNGTCIQTITLAAGNRTGSVYLKRLTGTGLIQVTLDGSTYSTVELSDTEWYRIVLSGSVTNPTVGIKIVVDGDAVAMDYGQVEDGLFVTTPILTTTATATRAVDLTSMSLINSIDVLNYQSGTAIINFNPPNLPIVGGSTILSANPYFRFYNTNAAGRFGLLAAGDNNNAIGDGSILPLFDNKIAASWAKTGIKRASKTGIFNERFPSFIIELPVSFNQLAASNSTTKRVTYYPFEMNINQLQELTK